MPDFLKRTAAIAARMQALLLQGDGAPVPVSGRYDRLVDALNRLPRPVLVYGTVALFLLALIRPDLFDRGMASLERMPEELWWLIGAVLAGHFGAREAHHLRARTARPPAAASDKVEKPAPAKAD
jgi:hypothetical protein